MFWRLKRRKGSKTDWSGQLWLGGIHQGDHHPMRKREKPGYTKKGGLSWPSQDTWKRDLANNWVGPTMVKRDGLTWPGMAGWDPPRWSPSRARTGWARTRGSSTRASGSPLSPAPASSSSAASTASTYSEINFQKANTVHSVPYYYNNTSQVLSHFGCEFYQQVDF